MPGKEGISGGGSGSQGHWVGNECSSFWGTETIQSYRILACLEKDVCANVTGAQILKVWRTWQGVQILSWRKFLERCLSRGMIESFSKIQTWTLLGISNRSNLIQGSAEKWTKGWKSSSHFINTRSQYHSLGWGTWQGGGTRIQKLELFNRK